MTCIYCSADLDKARDLTRKAERAADRGEPVDAFLTAIRVLKDKRRECADAGHGRSVTARQNAAASAALTRAT